MIGETDADLLVKVVLLLVLERGGQILGHTLHVLCNVSFALAEIFAAQEPFVQILQVRDQLALALRFSPLLL